jgi:hypothetical protein
MKSEKNNGSTGGMVCFYFLLTFKRGVRPRR